MTFSSGKDTSGEDLSKMTVKEKLKSAGSIQVVQRILINNINNIDYKDWMFAWKVIEEKRNQNVSFCGECIIGGWVPVGIKLIDEIVKDEKIYDMFQKLSKIITCVKGNDTVEYFVSSLMLKMGIEDMGMWLDALKRLISCTNNNKQFLRECVEVKFLSLGEKCLQGMSFSQAHHVLQKLEYLQVTSSNSPSSVNSFVRKLCLQEVLFYVPKNISCFEMYIDMMGSLGVIFSQAFLNQSGAYYCCCPPHGHNYNCAHILLTATSTDVKTFVEVCFAQIIQNPTKVKNIEQIKKIVELSKKFKNPSTEVRACYEVLQKLQIEGAQKALEDMIARR